MKKMMKILGAAVLLIGMATPVGAVTIYSNNNNGRDLITIDSNTGTVTYVAPFSPAGAVYGLEFTPDGTLWAMGWATDQLYTVDPATAVLTAVGTPGAVANLTQLASDSAGNLYATSDSSDILYSVDKVTGVATAIGSTGSGAIDLGISFDQAGILHGARPGSLLTIDPVSGLGTSGPSLVPALLGTIIGFAIDQSSGTAYLTNYVNPGSLYTVDLATGVVTTVGLMGTVNTLDMAIAWPAPAPAAAGGGGGCSLDASAGFDPLFGMLVLLALGVLYRRRNDI